VEILNTQVKIFPWIAEPEKAKRWQSNVKGGKIIKNIPEVIGTRFIEEVEEGGNSLEMEGEITKYIKNKLIGFQLESKVHKVNVSYSIEPIENHSRVSIDAEINWKFPINILSIFTSRKIREGIIRQTESECNELKRLCEG
jgi:hypothetical protein